MVFDSKSESDPSKGPGITFNDAERGLNSRLGPSLAMGRSNTMMSAMSRASFSSARSVKTALSGGRAMDPAVAVPVTYHSVSYNLENGKPGPSTGIPKDKSKGKLRPEKSGAVSTAEVLADYAWHSLDLKDLSGRLDTSLVNGLTSEGVKKNRSTYGSNSPPKPSRRLVQRIFGYFFGGFGLILLVGGILVFISWKPLGQPPAQANLALAIVLLVVFVVQAAFNAWQDFSSSRVLNSITDMLPESSVVIRDGNQVQVEAADIVPGDLLLFRAGNKLAADVRFVETSPDAKFDRSILTGESIPLGTSIDMTDDNYMETRNIGMQGTHCSAGSGRGVVVSTGSKTVFGRIAKLTGAPKSRRSPLERQVLFFVGLIVLFMLFMVVIALIVWGAYLRKDHPDWINTPTLIVDLVSIAIAFVPEGLPIAITTSLTICARAMKRHNILCKSLSTVETLGSVSVLLSDKTGTLTKNLMTVDMLSTGTSDMTVQEGHSEFEVKKEPITTYIAQVATLAGICNSGVFDASTSRLPLDQQVIIGDATDQACLRFSQSFIPVDDSLSLWNKTYEHAFNSKDKYMMRLFTADTSRLEDATRQALSPEIAFNPDDTLLTIKGAPDILIERCSSYLSSSGRTVGLDDSVRVKLEQLKNRWSADGRRVIALARKVLHPAEVGPTTTSEFSEHVKILASKELTLVGLLAIVDPPRDEIPSVVDALQTAGIRVMMVTGDFKLTAQAIAKQCGIFTSESVFVDELDDLTPGPVPRAPSHDSAKSVSAGRRISLVLSGAEINTLTSEQWDIVCDYKEVVFARTTPEQKLKIVQEYQSRDNTVGMTGDGVNDAPSLKQADVGIAPGSASDMALEAADMILLDSFSAIVQAVTYGRLAYDNLKKTIAYLLPAGSFSELWPVMTSILFGLPQILSSFLMIMICCFTDCAVGTVLAYEPPEADIMKRPPRSRKEYLVDWRLLLWSYGFIGVMETVLSFTMSYWYCQSQGLKFSQLWFKFGVIPSDMDADRYQSILNVASSIYFSNLVIMQWFVAMAVRARHVSIFSHPPIGKAGTGNWRLFPAILFAFCVIWIFCYPKSVQAVFNSGDIPVAHWFLPMALGLGILVLDEIRKALVRRYPKSLLAKSAW